MPPKKPAKMSEAQRKQRALYKAQAENPPKGERVTGWASVANRLSNATGLRVTR
jgi:hypothetical protein